MDMMVWLFQRPNDLLPILEGIGTCDNTLTESALVLSAITFIEKAGEFNGRAINEPPSVQRKSKIVVSFKIIFQTENALNQFIEFLKQKGLTP